MQPKEMGQDFWISDLDMPKVFEERKQRKTKRVLCFFGFWMFLAALSATLNAFNVDWDANPRWLGITIVIITAILQGSVLELVVMATATAVIGGQKRPPRRAPYGNLTIILNYNLLAHSTDDIDETLETMYHAYMNNLSENVSSVLVSATGDPKLKQYELQVRDQYRTKIYTELLREGRAFHEGRMSEVDNLRSQHIWQKYISANEDLFTSYILEPLCRRFAQGFMCIHRVSRVLKKCGQYQDLMLLSEGDDKAYSYTDPNLYGSMARKFGEPLFHESPDVANIRGRRFDYTLVLDGDTGVQRGTAFELLSIAAAYPDRGIVQPAIKMDVEDSDTVFMIIENVRQQVNDPITNAMTELMDQSGFYGKGLIRNRVYIDNIIGSRENLIERVPIDVLSHDTFEAACLRPLYASDVFLLEAPCLNYVTWDSRETRWNKGEILLSMYFWPNSVGKILRRIQIWVNGAPLTASSKPRTESHFDFVSSYVAHSALRNMFMKPLLLMFLVVHMFVHLHYPSAPIVIVMLLILIYPKIAVYDGQNFRKIIVEVFASAFQFTPEALVGTVRVLRAVKGNIVAGGKWIPQRAVEEELKKGNPFVSSFKHLWMFTASAAILIGAILYLDQFAANRNYLMFTMIGTLFLLPLFTAFTTMNAAVLQYLSTRHAKKQVDIMVQISKLYFMKYWKRHLSMLKNVSRSSEKRQAFRWDAGLSA